VIGRPAAGDFTYSYELAERFASALDPPMKACDTFEQSAHCPMAEEPARNLEILRQDVPQARVDLGRCLSH
jgi:hypothetical protein